MRGGAAAVSGDGGLHWAGVAWRSAWATHRDLVAVDAEAARAWRAATSAAPAYQAALLADLPRTAFVGRDADGRPLAPRRGRFYPARFLAGAEPAARFLAGGDLPARLPAGSELPAQSAWPPPRVFRVLSVDEERLRIDANSPLAGTPLAAFAESWPAHAACSAAGGGDALATLLATGVGLQRGPGDTGGLSATDGGRASVFFAAGRDAAAVTGESDAVGDDFARADASADRAFYRQPRLVQHIDATAQQVLATMHAGALGGLPPQARVLDLMSGWATHLPAGDEPGVCGLGLNGAELAANARLAERCIADLNARPALPFADASFDAAICALSVEYLIDPLAVFREVARVLRPGAPFVVSWSERWFPPKAIRLWAALHPYERVALVIDCFRLSGGWQDIAAESRRGLRRPPDDRYAGRLPHADPLYRVLAYKDSVA